MSETVISVKNLSKRYRIGLEEKQYDTFVKQFFGWLTYPFKNFKNLVRLSRFTEKHDDSVFWALKDINFEVKKGEVLGVIGHNGAGKSTLLKILSRITEPTTGEVTIQGKVSSLLEVGTGFHPDLTGRENVYMNGTILGMSKKEIDQKFDEIISFSGVKKYIDTPVKRYSSGMKVRLAFSVAAHLEPEILIIDEVLAVGDLEFQKKCLGKMEEVSDSGRTVLFVSHNMAAVENLCQKCLLLDSGTIKGIGKTRDVINKYLESGANNSSNTFKKELNGEEGIEDISINLESRGKDGFQPGDILKLQLHFNKKDKVPIESIKLSYHFLDQKSNTIFICNPKFIGKELKDIKSTKTITCTINNLPLTPGKYYINLWLQLNHHQNLKIDNILGFEVSSGDFYNSGGVPKNNSIIYINQTWDLHD